ncbi:hypothetical protein EC890511_1670, partial [Escherichia coli 89.0511]
AYDQRQHQHAEFHFQLSHRLIPSSILHRAQQHRAGAPAYQ